eukprot:5018221-Amphidinium_carterae.1
MAVVFGAAIMVFGQGALVYTIRAQSRTWRLTNSSRFNTTASRSIARTKTSFRESFFFQKTPFVPFWNISFFASGRGGTALTSLHHICWRD